MMIHGDFNRSLEATPIRFFLRSQAQEEEDIEASWRSVTWFFMLPRPSVCTVKNGVLPP